MSRRFVQTLSYTVGELREGAHAGWLKEAEAVFGGIPGLDEWQLFRERTGDRRFTHLLVYRDREAFHAVERNDETRDRVDGLLQRLGGVVEVESVDIRLHDPVPVELAGRDDENRTR